MRLSIIPPWPALHRLRSKISSFPLSILLPHILNFPTDQFPNCFPPISLFWILFPEPTGLYLPVPQRRDAKTQLFKSCSVSPVSCESCLGLAGPAGKRTGRENSATFSGKLTLIIYVKSLWKHFYPMTCSYFSYPKNSEEVKAKCVKRQPKQREFKASWATIFVALSNRKTTTA